MIALGFSIAAFTLAIRPKTAENADIQYVLYLGTNDKDSNEPVFTPEEAQKQAEAILIAYKAKYPEKVGHFGEMDLAAIVAEMTETE